MNEMEVLHYREHRDRVERNSLGLDEVPRWMSRSSSFDATRYVRSAWSAISRVVGPRSH